MPSREVWQVTAAGPGVIRVPGFDHPMRVRAAYGDGTIVYDVPGPDGRSQRLVCHRERLDGPAVEQTGTVPIEVPAGRTLLTVVAQDGRAVSRRYDTAEVDAAGIEALERLYRMLEQRLFEAPPDRFPPEQP
jgi:hypothetical protein